MLVIKKQKKRESLIQAISKPNHKNSNAPRPKPDKSNVSVYFLPPNMELRPERPELPPEPSPERPERPDRPELPLELPPEPRPERPERPDRPELPPELPPDKRSPQLPRPPRPPVEEEEVSPPVEPEAELSEDEESELEESELEEPASEELLPLPPPVLDTMKAAPSLVSPLLEKRTRSVKLSYHQKVDNAILT